MFPDPLPIVDAKETVTLIGAGGGSRTVAGAVRAAITGRGLGGAPIVYRTVWNLPTASLAPLPVVGETLVDSAARRWRITATNLAAGGKRFFVAAAATGLPEPESPVDDPVLTAIAAGWASRLPSIPLLTGESLPTEVPYAVLTDEGTARVITTNGPTPIERRALRIDLWDVDRPGLLLTRSPRSHVAAALHRFATTTTDGRRLFLIHESQRLEEDDHAHRAILRFTIWLWAS